MFRAVLLTLVVLVPMPVCAEDEALAIVNKAITAHAGKDGKLEKLQTAVIAQKGTVYTPVGELSATRKITAEWPKKTRIDLGLAQGNGEKRMTVVVDGTTGWQKIGGMAASESSSEERETYRADVHAVWVSTIIPLKDKGFTLTLLPESSVDGNAVVGVKASYRNRPDVALYFDKSTGLLAKTSFKGKEVGALVLKESTFSEYKEFSGLNLPTKQVETADGRKAFEWKSATYEFLDSLPKELFAKP